MVKQNIDVSASNRESLRRNRSSAADLSPHDRKQLSIQAIRRFESIAQIAQEGDFEKRWLAARDTEAIRNLILLSTRKRDADQSEP